MSEDKAAGAGASEGTSAGASENTKGVRLVRRAPRTARSLDPHGVYDARSMARRRLAQRRRSLSSMLLLGVAIVAGATVIFQGREPHVASWAPLRTLDLELDVAALAALPPRNGATGQVVAVARDGRVAVLDDRGRAQLWDAGDFPLSVRPLIARGLAIVGGEDGELRAFDLASRRLKWHSQGDNAISSRPAFFSTASTSTPAWAPSPAPVPGSSPTSPARAGASTAPSSPDDSSATGAVTATSASAEPGASSAAPEAAVAVGDDGGMVRALRLSDGKTLWSVGLSAPCGGGLSVARVSGGRTLIFVPQLSGAARRGGVAALDARDGKVLWRYPRDERVFASVPTTPLARAVDGRMRLFFADDAGAVSALDAATGRSPAALASASSRAGGEWKTFLAPISESSGGARSSWARWLWRGSGAPSEPLLVSARAEPLWIVAARGPLLVVAGNDGGVRALEARSGHLAWSADAGEAPIALLKAPSQSAGTSLVIVTPRAVERRDAESGRRLSRFEWGPEMGRAQSASSTPSHLFVAGRRMEVFDWATAP